MTAGNNVTLRSHRATFVTEAEARQVLTHPHRARYQRSLAPWLPGDAGGRGSLDRAALCEPPTPPRSRGEILRRTYEPIVSRQASLALLMAVEMAKPLSESSAEAIYAAEFLSWF